MRVRLEVVWRDLWVGVFWRKKAYPDPSCPVVAWRGGRVVEGRMLVRYDVWVCLVPCLPIHLSWERPSWESP